MISWAAMPSTKLAQAVLDTMRKHLGLTMNETSGEVFRIEAVDGCGERWYAEDADFYRAACLLAEVVGFELEE